MPIIIFILTLLINLCFAQTSSQKYMEYRVLEGENISRVLFRLGLSPLWGPNGYVRKTIDLNRYSINKDGEILYQYALIKIPILKKVNENLVAAPAPLPVFEVPPLLPKKQTPVLKRKTAFVQSRPIAKKEDLLYSYLEPSLGAQFWELDSEEKSDNSKAHIESKLALSFEGRLVTRWSPMFSSSIGLGQSKVSFKQPTGKRITNADNSLSDLFVGLVFDADENWSLGGEFHHRQNPYLRAISQTDIKIETPWMQQVQLNLERKIIKKRNGYFSVRLSPYYLSSKKLNDFKIESGYGARAELRVKQKLKSFAIHASFYSDYASQESSITKQTTRSNGLILSLVFPLGGASL